MTEHEHPEQSVVALLRHADERTRYCWTPDVGLAVAQGAARRRRARARLSVAGGALAASMLAAAVVLVSGGTGARDTVIAADVSDVPLTVSALDGSEPLPSPDPSSLLDEGTGRFETRGVLVYDKEDYPAFQVRLGRTSEDRICIEAELPQYGAGGGGACQPRSQMLTEGVVTVGGWPDYTFKMVVVLPDGYATARAGGETFRVENNVAVMSFSEPPEGELTVDGPGVPDVTWPLTDFWGTSPDAWDVF